VLADNHALIVTAQRKPGATFGDVEVLDLPNADGRVDLVALMRVLTRRGINEVHVEADVIGKYVQRLTASYRTQPI